VQKIKKAGIKPAV